MGAEVEAGGASDAAMPVSGEQKILYQKLRAATPLNSFLSASQRLSVSASLLTLLFILFSCSASFAQAKRLVVIKVDGLPTDMVDRFVREHDPQSGKSLLPWFEEVFYKHGARVSNFYVRGMSLSAPSWSLLETGQHLQIKGNVEFDRMTLHSYDYLNFLPFYFANAFEQREDMPGTIVLDSVGIPMLVDAFGHNERLISYELYQRGLRWSTLQRGAQNRFTRSPRELMDEWTMGFELRDFAIQQVEREIIERLTDPRVKYMDLFVADFDHTAHHNRDREAHLYSLQRIDAIIGRIWTAIQQSPFAADTALVVVSDHGFNTDEHIYSQGFNLVKLLGSTEGGGHHVITKRRLMMDYSIKGINPFTTLITTTTQNSCYLKGQSSDYPTALLDFDGNERAGLHLRDSDINLLHIILEQLKRQDISLELRQALTESFFQTVDRRRSEWSVELSQLQEEMDALHRAIVKMQAQYAELPKKWTEADRAAGRVLEARRLYTRMKANETEELDYRKYASAISNLLSLHRESFDAKRLKIEDVIPKGAMGDRNSIHELQNYVVCMAPGGPVLKSDGSLDMQKSFTRIDYYDLLHSQTVRNNVQQGVSNHPVDFIATRIPREQIARLLPPDLQSDEDAVWLYDGPEHQALILARADDAGRLKLRYLPVKHLSQDETGAISFERAEWAENFPLRIWEDANLQVAEGERGRFLNDWHTDVQWLHALHKTEYSNGLIGLNEQMILHPSDALSTDARALSDDERLIRRFRQRQRELVETDLLILANNHWNFDVRGFNPGGNHGSFFRISTHATLMMAGGAETGIPQGEDVTEPYDSLSFVPTMMALLGKLPDGHTPVPVLWDRGFRPFPGRVIQEVLSNRRVQPANIGAGGTH